MSNDSSNDMTVRSCIDAIESTYEYMLAYAAQGRDKEGGGPDGPSIRNFLTSMSQALGAIEGCLKAEVSNGNHENADALKIYAEVVGNDARIAKAAVDLVLSVPSIGSQLIDNLNASIHLRALLTSLFLIDEAMKPKG